MGLSRLLVVGTETQVAADQADDERDAGRGGSDLEGDRGAVHVGDQYARDLIIAEVLVVNLGGAQTDHGGRVNVGDETAEILD